jgi:hypothetical protein
MVETRAIFRGLLPPSGFYTKRQALEASCGGSGLDGFSKFTNSERMREQHGDLNVA